MTTNQKLSVNMKPDQEELWLNSKDVLKALKISSCELCHLRQAGKLQFQKRGNAFLYASKAVKSMAGAPVGTR